ncbi:MAG: type II toxin-antitoxin system YafQ family toxin [Oscillospiraceae bacterium]|nr:type II toxin-antitoxin system YafQ family toxin [Oscillospiraceae bacterium]
MVYEFTFTSRFEKNYKKLSQTEKKQVIKKLKILAENPLHPSLRTKRIQGTERLYECSINMDIRIIWHYEGNTIIILLDVGHHDILRKF